MAALAALIIAVGGIVVWHFQDAQKAADWAVAYVYPMAKPVNTTHFWLGAQASFADVKIARVLVDGKEYYTAATAPYGKTVWLNYSGRPLLARCNSTVVIEVARGSASRALTFKAVCPREIRFTTDYVGYAVDLNQIQAEANAYASFVFTYLEFLNNSVLAVDVGDNGRTAYIALYNTWKWPLFIYTAPAGSWGLHFSLFDPFRSNPLNFVGTLMPGDYLYIWPVGDVWTKNAWSLSQADWVKLAVAYRAFLTDSFGYVNGRLEPNSGTVVSIVNPQYVGTRTWRSSSTVSPTVYLRFPYGDILVCPGTIDNPYNCKNLGKTGVAVAYVENSNANLYKVYYGYRGTSGPIVIYAFPAMSVVGNATSSGPQYLEIGGKPVYGQAVVQGVAGLSPVRIYAVEARNNYTHWLISAGVPGFSIAQNESVLIALAKPGGYAAVEISTGYIRIRTPDGRTYERRTPYYWDGSVPGFKTYKSPIVTYLTPDGKYWAALVGYKPGTNYDSALLIKSNAQLTCPSAGPSLYILSEGRSCTGAGATLVYRRYDTTVFFEVRVPVAVGRDGKPVEITVYRLETYAGYPLSNTDPGPFFSGSKIRAVWIELVNGTYARAYVKDYPGDAGSVPAAPPGDAQLVKNGTQFSVPVLYDISPKGVKPYLLYIDANAYDRCAEPYRDYVSTFGAELYYGGKLVSFYKQQLIVTKIDASCGRGTPVSITLSSPTCHPVRRESLNSHTQKDFQWNPDGTYRTEVWGRFKITEVDCKGNINTRHEERILYVVRRGHGTYSNADPDKGKVCGINEIDPNTSDKVVRCK